MSCAASHFVNQFLSSPREKQREKVRIWGTHDPVDPPERLDRVELVAMRQVEVSAVESASERVGDRCCACEPVFLPLVSQCRERDGRGRTRRPR